MPAKMTRAEIDKLLGRAPKEAPKQEPAAPTAQLEQQLAALAAQVAQNTAVVARAAQVLANPPAAPAAKEKKLEAIIHRDEKGRMARVDITVT